MIELNVVLLVEKGRVMDSNLTTAVSDYRLCLYVGHDELKNLCLLTKFEMFFCFHHFVVLL